LKKKKNVDQLADPLNSKQSFPIKLYIAEPPDEVKQASEEGLPSSVKFAILMKFTGLFGLAHAALQIGDKMVHFLDNHFVKIDSFKASNALYLTNISRSGRLPNKPEVKRTIAEVIVDFNVNKMYSQAKLNCQDFVERLCKQVNEKCKDLLDDNTKLDLHFEQNKLIREYLDLLIKYPQKSGFIFKKRPKEGQKFDKEEDAIVVFETHKELDNWEEDNKAHLNAHELEFLKGFHRAFQLRFEAAELNGDAGGSHLYKPDDSHGCSQGNATVV
jgi:hypothetical protein